MLTNDQAAWIPKKCVPRSEPAGRLQPIAKLCVLRTGDCEMTAFWKPRLQAWGLVEVDRREGV